MKQNPSYMRDAINESLVRRSLSAEEALGLTRRAELIRAKVEAASGVPNRTSPRNPKGGSVTWCDLIQALDVRGTSPDTQLPEPQRRQ